MTSLSVINTPIRRDAEGRYSLNDLHKAAVAAGANKRAKEPSKFLKSESVKSLVKELDLDNPINIKEGRNGGTYAPKPVAIEYLRWAYGSKASLMICEKIEGLEALLEALDSFEIPDDLPDMYVYAIREKESGRIKIGISKDPERRMKQLQTGNSQELELVAYKKADNKYKDEKELHLLHSDKKLRGEWFASSVCL